jgi:hypothetical protein
MLGLCWLADGNIKARLCNRDRLGFSDDWPDTCLEISRKEGRYV